MDKLHCMQCFVRVAEARGFAGAAHVLGVSPSSISKIIAAFESTLGFALFNRSTRHFSLTESGAAYLEECRRIFEHIERAESQGRHQRELPSGIIKVAMHPAFRFSFFSEVERFITNYGDVKLETKMTNSTSVLFDEGFDVLIRVGELPDSTLVARRIGWLELIVGAAPAYLAKYGVPKTPTDLEQHRWAVHARVDDGSSPHYEFIKGKRRCAITVHPCIKVRDGMGLLEGVIGGACIACLYDIAFSRAIELGLVKPLVADWKTRGRPVYAVFPNAHGITPKAKALVDFYAELVANVTRANRRSLDAFSPTARMPGRPVPLRPFRRRAR